MAKVRWFGRQREAVQEDPASDLRDTDLSGAVNLTAAQIEATCGNAGTRLPQGIAMPAEWQCSGRE